jgi:hypothetical protein
MWQSVIQSFMSIRRPLHGHYDGIKNEPLPERWVDLIHYLDERERRMLAAVEIREYLAPSRREHGPTRGMDTTPTSALVARHVGRASDGGSGGLQRTP